MTNILRNFCILLCTIIIMASCSNEKSPKAVAEKFLTAVNSNKIPDAKNYCSERVYKFLTMASMDSGQKEIHKFEIIREKEEGEWVSVIFKMDGDPAEKKLDLTKINGEWKVDMKIAAMPNTNTMDQPAPDPNAPAPTKR